MPETHRHNKTKSCKTLTGRKEDTNDETKHSVKLNTTLNGDKNTMNKIIIIINNNGNLSMTKVFFFYFSFFFSHQFLCLSFITIAVREKNTSFKISTKTLTMTTKYFSCSLSYYIIQIYIVLHALRALYKFCFSLSEKKDFYTRFSPFQIPYSRFFFYFFFICRLCCVWFWISKGKKKKFFVPLSFPTAVAFVSLFVDSYFCISLNAKKSCFHFFYFRFSIVAFEKWIYQQSTKNFIENYVWKKKRKKKRRKKKIGL